MSARRRFHSIMFALVFLGLFLLNTHLFHSPILGPLLLVLYIGHFGYELGCVVHQETGVVRWWVGAWMLLSLLSLTLTACYYLAHLSPTIVEVTVLLSVPIILWLAEHKGRPHWFERVHDLWKTQRHSVPQIVWLTASFILVLLSYLFWSYVTHPILDAVRTPWGTINASVLIASALVFLLLFALLYRGRERALSMTLFSLALFATISLVAFVFPIGFGFDSFIHKATESHIAEFGTITPKPLYYIGQYALVLLAHHGFFLSIDVADTFLLPILTALLLPLAVYSAGAHLLNHRRRAMSLLLGVWFLPLSVFIVTTPQGVANLWTLLLILASVPYLLKQEHPRLFVLAIGALATVLIHPIAGLPTLFYVALLFTDPSRAPHRYETFARISFWILSVVACLVLPASFIANAIVSKQALTIHWAALNPLTLIQGMHLNIFLQNNFNPLLDFVYLFGLNASLLVLVFAVLGVVTHRTLTRRLLPLLVMAVALGVNYLLMKASIDFSFLIDYERQNYTDRLVPLILFFLTPFLLLGLASCLESIRKRPLILRVTVIVFCAAFASSLYYMTYPRHDAYAASHGFNVSQADVDAVLLVEQMAEGQPYLVLANQSVSAAAIQEIGFRYYGDLFFYPIPTGGPLYQRFLDMNTKPSIETAQQALGLVPMHGDIKKLFYIVNSYWWEAPRLIETSKTLADDWRSLNQGSVYVFEFDVE